MSLWLDANPVRDVVNLIQEKHGWEIGVSTVQGIVSAARKESPDVDELRQLKQALSKSGKSPAEAVRGLNFLSKLETLGASLDELPSLIKINELFGDKADDYLHAAERLLEMEGRLGKSTDQIFRDYEKTRSDLEKMRRRVADLQSDESQLLSKIGDLLVLKELETTCEGEGFSPDLVRKLVKSLFPELRDVGMSVPRAASEIIKNLESKKSLSSKTEEMTSILEQLSAQVKVIRSEKDSAQASVDALALKQRSLRRAAEEEEQAIREKTRSLQESYDAHRQRLLADLTRLDEKKDVSQEKLTLAEVLFAVITEPGKVSPEDLANLQKAISYARDDRSKGSTILYEVWTDDIKATIAKILKSVFEKDLVPARDYDRLKEKLEDQDQLKGKLKEESRATAGLKAQVREKDGRLEGRQTEEVANFLAKNYLSLICRHCNLTFFCGRGRPPRVGYVCPSCSTPLADDLLYTGPIYTHDGAVVLMPLLQYQLDDVELTMEDGDLVVSTTDHSHVIRVPIEGSHAISDRSLTGGLLKVVLSRTKVTGKLVPKGGGGTLTVKDP